MVSGGRGEKTKGFSNVSKFERVLVIRRGLEESNKTEFIRGYDKRLVEVMGTLKKVSKLDGMT